MTNRSSRSPAHSKAANPKKRSVRGEPAQSQTLPAEAASSEPLAGEENTAYLLRQVAERLGISLIEALRPFNQTPAVYRVLIALTRRNPVRMRELIELTLIETSVLSRTVAKMKTQGLVNVSVDAQDARAVVVEITADGRTLLDAMIPAVSAQYDWAVHDVPPDDLETMRLTLARMFRNLKISPIK